MVEFERDWSVASRKHFMRFLGVVNNVATNNDNVTFGRTNFEYQTTEVRDLKSQLSRRNYN